MSAVQLLQPFKERTQLSEDIANQISETQFVSLIY